MKKYTYLLLSALPVLYLLISLQFNALIGKYSMRNVDPEYVYFMTALTVSEGKLNVGHVDHPGTPLQYLTALTFKLTYLFRSHDVPYLEDVLSHADLYLNMAHHTVSLAIALVMFFAGIAMARITKVLPYALMVQTSPFISQITYDMIGRMIPDLLLPVPAMLTMVLIMKVLQSGKSDRLTVLQFALVSAFGLSIKLTYLPLILIPYFLIQGIRQKLMYSLYTILGFCLFAIPAIVRFNFFWNWSKSLFLHSGQYGGGESNIVNIPEMMTNLNIIWQTTKPFFIWIILLIIITVIYGILKKKNAQKSWFFAVAGIILIVLAQILMVSKHYSYRYLVPALSFAPILLILNAEGLIRIFSNKTLTRIVLGILLLLFIPGIQRQLSVMQFASYMIGDVDMYHRQKTWHFVKNLPDDATRLIVCQEYGCPFSEYGLMFAHEWSGAHHDLIRPTLQKLYPHTYQYYPIAERIKGWNDTWDTNEILSSDRPVYLYMEKEDTELEEKFLKYFFEPSVPTGQISRSRLFYNDHTREAIYQLTYHPGDTSGIVVDN